MTFSFVRRIEAICTIDGVGRLIEAFLVDAQGFTAACRNGRRSLWQKSAHRRRLITEIWYRSLSASLSPYQWPLKCTVPTFFDKNHEEAVLHLAAHLRVVQDVPAPACFEVSSSSWYQQWPLEELSRGSLLLA